MSQFDTNNEQDNLIEPNNEPIPSKPKTNFFKGLIEQLELIIIAFAIIIIIFSFVFRTCEVSGTSMENTLYNKETVLISNMFYLPKRNDIIVFHQTGENYNEPIVKRVIGVAGDTVKIEYFNNTMKVTVTDSSGKINVLNEDYIKYNGSSYHSDSTTYVEEGTIFVMGDNRSVSADSRVEEIGLVDTRRILGKVIVRLTPFSKFGKVN